MLGTCIKSKNNRIPSVFSSPPWLVWELLFHPLKSGGMRSKYLGRFGPLSLQKWLCSTAQLWLKWWMITNLILFCWQCVGCTPHPKKSEMKVYNESLLKNICFIIHKLELSSWVPEAVEVFCFQATVSVNVCGNFPSIKGQKTRRFFPDEARLGDLALRALGGGNCSLRSSFPSSLFQPGLEPWNRGSGWCFTPNP